MEYTKQQLKDSFCEARGWDESKETKAQFLTRAQTEMQEILDWDRSYLQEQIDKIPLLASKRMKQIALDHLNKQANKATIADNDAIDI